MNRTVFVSGHLDLTEAEFNEHYRPRLSNFHQEQCSFVVGDAAGCDVMTQLCLRDLGASVTVFHMFTSPRNNPANHSTRGGFSSDEERDSAMTQASTEDLAWVRPGRERSGTARNLKRRARK
jgi:hypothetical protein